MSDLIQDLRFGFRTLRRSPGFSIVALLTIAVGIGANASIFSYIDGSLLRPLPYAAADRMVRVAERSPEGAANRVSALTYDDWAKESTIFEYLAAQQWNTAALTGIDNPVQIANERVGLHFFDVFTGRPVIGRTFAAGEDQPGRDRVAVLSHAFWVSQFNSDPKILGRTLLLDGDPYTVIGVMESGTFDRTSTKLWRPLAYTGEEKNRFWRRFNAWAILKPGVSLEQARSQMAVIESRIAHDFPQSNKGWTVAVDSMASIRVGSDIRRSLYILMGSVGMVLLIACANLANLTLARGAARGREVAIRASLGAGRGRLVRQFLTESLLLSFGGSALGLAGAFGGLAVLKRLIPEHYLPPATYVEMDGRMLLFILALALVTGLIFGLYPAIRASRPDLSAAIKQGGQGSGTGPAGHRLRGALVTAEVALAFVLLTGAGLLIRSFFKIQQVDPGFDSTNVVTAYLPTTFRRFPTAPPLDAMLTQLVARVGGIPGVRDVALTSALPMEGWGWGMRFGIAGKRNEDASHEPVCYYKMVSPSYLRALGMRLARGRFLGEHDLAGTVPVTVINQTMADKYFKDQDPVGQHLLIQKIHYGPDNVGPDEVPWEIVGVVADEKLRGLSDGGDASPGVYVTTAQCLQAYQAIVIRTSSAPGPVMQALPGVIHEVDPNQTVDGLRTLDDIKADSVGDQRIQSLLLGIFAGIAMLLSALGLYGVISYSVQQRTREIGIRTALGATSGNILWLVLRNGLRLTALGLLIGGLGSIGVGQVLASMLFEVGRYDPVTLWSVAALLLAMAVVSSYLPARRAVRLDPVVALRQE